MSDKIEQLTQEQAKAMYDGGTWKSWTDEELVKFQLYQDRLCVPFDRFHAAVEKVFGRPVWTHEFGFREHLIEEYEGKRPKATFEDVVNLIPKDKLIIVKTGLLIFTVWSLLLSSIAYAESPRRPKVEPQVFTSPLYEVEFVLPDSLLDDVDELAGWMDIRASEFLTQCYKWQDNDKCDQALERSVVTLVDDYSFFCGRASPTSLCRGLYSGRGRIKTVIYERRAVQSASECAGGTQIRDRQDMYELSRGNKYWLTHAANYFCGDLGSIIPVALHEWGHFFGPRVGHVPGYEEVQSIPRRP